jgi:hypothetical protein
MPNDHSIKAGLALRNLNRRIDREAYSETVCIVAWCGMLAIAAAAVACKFLGWTS